MRMTAVVVWMVVSASLGFGQGPSRTPTGGAPVTVEGCLTGSEGNYRLVGNGEYRLAGDPATLSQHLGERVQVTGTTEKSGNPAASENAETSSEQKTKEAVPSSPATLTVTDVTRVGGGCR